MKSKFSQERRDVLKGACALAGATAVVTVSGSLPAFAAAQKDVPQVGDVFVFTEGPNKGNVVNVADVVLDAPSITVQAKDPAGAIREGDNNIVMLYRVAPDKVPSDMQSETAEGIMAYSAICTHQGCINVWDAEKKQFICPCHAALFDPLQNGKNTAGATSRTLPQFRSSRMTVRSLSPTCPAGTWA